MGVISHFYGPALSACHLPRSLTLLAGGGGGGGSAARALRVAPDKRRHSINIINTRGRNKLFISYLFNFSDLLESYISLLVWRRRLGRSGWMMLSVGSGGITAALCE